jgi:hypothetical protein
MQLRNVQELRYPGIVLNTIMLVFGTAASLLAAYQARIIRVGDNFRNGKCAAYAKSTVVFVLVCMSFARSSKNSCIFHAQCCLEKGCGGLGQGTDTQYVALLQSLPVPPEVYIWDLARHLVCPPPFGPTAALHTLPAVSASLLTSC